MGHAGGAVFVDQVAAVEAFQREAGVERMRRKYRTYTARLEGAYLDLRGQAASQPQIYDSSSYTAAQAIGEKVRMDGGDGVLFDSLRHAGGLNVVAYRPTKVLDVVQTEHFAIDVEAAAPRIAVTRLTLT